MHLSHDFKAAGHDSGGTAGRLVGSSGGGDEHLPRACARRRDAAPDSKMPPQ